MVSHGLIGRVMISTLLNLERRIALDVRQPNDTVFRITIGAGRTGADRFVAGAGPFAGLRAE